MTTIIKLLKNCFAKLNNLNRISTNRKYVPLYSILGATATSIIVYKIKRSRSVKLLKLTSREKRFIEFASIEFNGQIYMTPQDFLESIIEVEPKPRLKRKILDHKDLDKIKNTTPPLNKSSSSLFRNLENNGILSYTEYLFLICILIKPQSAFKIAFNMFDTDGNQKVDKNEFLLIEKIFSNTWKKKRNIKDSKPNNKSSIMEQYVDDEQGLQRKHIVDTTILIHLFGPKGNVDLNFDTFNRFALNLQAELLEIEFVEFSKDLPTISELDFAKILLRYTYLDTDECNDYINRFKKRVRVNYRITFEEFKLFCQFLNNIDDFSNAIRIYTLADVPISIKKFRRAFKICTGKRINKNLAKIVFDIFDENEDGFLSNKEFIALMKNRLQRGFMSHKNNRGWNKFKKCFKQEFKTFILFH